MKIKQSTRVKYDHNPLVEVLCQIRFGSVLRLTSGSPEDFQRIFANKYPKLVIEQVASIHFSFGAGQPPAQEAIPPTAAAPIYHFISEDAKSKVSINSDFISFSCEVYERWEGFRNAALEVFNAFLEIYPEAIPNRVGLRYKDLIVRESLGLSGVPWGRLVTPFVAGIFAVEDFFDEPLTLADETNIQQASQATLQLKECGLFVQSMMLRSNEPQSKTAFLIDSDFFRESSKWDLIASRIPENLEALHSSADALFRRCITEELHDALGPNPIASEA